MGGTNNRVITIIGSVLLRRRANARSVSFQFSLRWPIHIIDPADKTKLLVSSDTPRRRNSFFNNLPLLAIIVPTLISNFWLKRQTVNNRCLETRTHSQGQPF